MPSLRSAGSVSVTGADGDHACVSTARFAMGMRSMMESLEQKSRHAGQTKRLLYTLRLLSATIS